MAKKKKKMKQKSPGTQRVMLVVKILFLLILLTILAGAILFYMSYGKTAIKLHEEAVALVRQSTIDTFRQSETSEIYDINGKLITTLKGEKDTYYLEYDLIPAMAKQAMISMEDKKFLTHKGYDIRAIIRAAKSYIENHGEINQGGSTITQQLARNIFLTHEVSWERKAKEIFLAVELEKKYSKDLIMEFYLNNIYFNNGYYGIQAASKGYFSRDVNELSLAEITFLCAIPNNPTLYEPTENMENTIGRKNRMLGQMKLDGAIGDQEYFEAENEEIILKLSKRKKQNYIETYVYNCAIRALMKSQGFTFRYTFNSQEEKERYQERYSDAYTMCQQSLYSSGYRIYTSIDTKKQKLLQAAVDDVLKNFEEKNEEGIYKLQGAATCIDNETGRVAAIVGGRSQKLEGYTLNRAYQSYRQPGSAIKPLIVYAPALERGYTPDTLVVDKKTEDGPKNSNGTYAGKISLRSAVEQSKNTVAWNLFKELTPDIGLQYLLNMNFSKISENDYYLAASLGGFTTGVSSVEMASGYAALENDGIFREPTCIISIVDSRETEVYRDISAGEPIYDTNASRVMTDILKGVFTKGTAKGLGLSNMSCAGKTGTTSDKKDGWFVGFTPYYTTSVWVGYDLPQKLDSLAGATYPGTIWKQYMGEIHEGLEDIGFKAYEKPKKTVESEPVEEKDEPEIDNTEPETNEEDPDFIDETNGEPEGTPEDSEIPAEDGEGDYYYNEGDEEEEVPDETPSDETEEPVEEGVDQGTLVP